MDKIQIKELLKKYAYNTISFQSLIDGLNYFEVTQRIEGFIPYIKIGHTFLAVGDPICDEDSVYDLVHDFRKFCKKEKSYCCFLSVSEKFKHKLDLMGFGNLKIGEEGIFDFPAYSFEGSKMKVLRNSVNHAKNKGVTVRRVEYYNDLIFSKILKLNNEWLTTRKVKGFSFLLKLNPTENFDEKIIFIAELDNVIVGYLSCIPIYKRNGWYFEDLIRSEAAPNGTNHFLVYEAVAYLKSKEFQMATLGTSPLGNIEKIDNPDYKSINKILKFAYEHIHGFYNFRGLHDFKESFNPSRWEEKFFSFYPVTFKPKLILAIIKAYDPAGLNGIMLSKLKKILLKK
ncbi:MAG: DUF2156 domain-containing protein [Nanoarchaeota archaeon]